MRYERQREKDRAGVRRDEEQQGWRYARLADNGQIANTRPQSVAEGLLIITLAVGRTIQILGTIMGVDPKTICRDFCNSLTKYFEMGGDGRIDDIAASINKKGN